MRPCLLCLGYEAHSLLVVGVGIGAGAWLSGRVQAVEERGFAVWCVAYYV